MGVGSSFDSEVAYGQKVAKPLHGGPKHQIWYMHSLGQYSHFWRGVPEFWGARVFFGGIFGFPPEVENWRILNKNVTKIHFFEGNIVPSHFTK